MHRDLVFRFVEVQTILLSPICPHTCEYFWKILGKVSSFKQSFTSKSGSVRNAKWPVVGEVNTLAIQMKEYLIDAMHFFNVKLKGCKQVAKSK